MLGLEYIKKIEQSIDHARGQGHSFAEAARLIADCVTKRGRLYIHDPGNMVSSEALIRSGGLVMIKKLRVSDFPEADLSRNDVVVVFLKRSRLQGDFAFVRAIKKRGAKIVGVFPTDSSHSGRPSLAEFSDVAIDNGLTSEVGVLEVDGFDEPICPVDIVVNSMLVFALGAEIIGELLRRGRKPSVFMSARVQGGQEYDQRILEQYARQGF